MDNPDFDQPNFSFEFFPPKTQEGAIKLEKISQTLAELDPRFFSVTFGAGGSTRENTRETVGRIFELSGIPVAPHLSCIGSTQAGIREILSDYMESGIRHLVALRGDLPSGTRDFGEFRYANELVEFIRNETGEKFFIEVACYPEFHPQASDAFTDLQNFKRKVDAGADSAITQYFFNIDAYFSFIDNCDQLGIDIPIIPGIMPINNYAQLARFSDACGAEIPRWIRRRLESYRDDIKSIKAFGLDVITSLCSDLLEQGAPGLHFYTMNQTEPMMTIWNNLDLSNYGVTDIEEDGEDSDK